MLAGVLNQGLRQGLLSVFRALLGSMRLLKVTIELSYSTASHCDHFLIVSCIVWAGTVECTACAVGNYASAEGDISAVLCVSYSLWIHILLPYVLPPLFILVSNNGNLDWWLTGIFCKISSIERWLSKISSLHLWFFLYLSHHYLVCTFGTVKFHNFEERNLGILFWKFL